MEEDQIKENKMKSKLIGIAIVLASALIVVFSLHTYYHSESYYLKLLDENFQLALRECEEIQNVTYTATLDDVEVEYNEYNLPYCTAYDVVDMSEEAGSVHMGAEINGYTITYNEIGNRDILHTIEYNSLTKKRLTSTLDMSDYR